MKNLIPLAFISLFLILSCAEKKTFKQPKKLQTEYQTNPVGIDITKPRFTWQLNDTSRGAKQTACHIIVASDLIKLKNDTGDIWDSKKVESDQSLLVRYGGPAPESRKVYYWKVRTWDQNGEVSSWSEPASMEMGLLNREDWQAKWIGLDVEPDRSEMEKYGNWIWHPEEKGLDIPVYVRKSFTLPEGKTVRKAMLSATADNEFEGWINGIEAARRIKATSPSAQIVMLTIHSGHSYRADATAAGASAYVTKKAMHAELVPTLAALLGGGHN